MKKFAALFSIILPVLLAALVLIINQTRPAQAAGTPAAEQQAAQTPVYYYGLNPSPDQGVLRALRLIPDIVLVEDPQAAVVLVMNGVIPDVTVIREHLQAGGGMVLILGPEITQTQITTIFNEPVTLRLENSPLSLVADTRQSDPLLTEIVWSSAPQIRERGVLIDGGLAVLVSGFEDNSVVLGARQDGEFPVFVLASYLDGANPQIQEWAYFNYLIYHLIERAAGRQPLSYADYPASPVPHARDRLVIFGILALLLASAFTVFWLVRRYSLNHPEALDAVVSREEKFAEREAGTDWEEVGFHRPLGGFFVALMMGLVLFIPLIIYQNLILPVYILPSAQALGIWGRVTQFFGMIWWFFDFGTSTAFIKYLSQHRVKNPRRAIQYGQVFVWWQALSGVIQVAIMLVLAGTWLPETAYAIYAWSVVLHTLVQIPGFFQVFRNALTGLQRYDYAQILDVALSLIFPILVQPLIVLASVAWGRANPVFGPSMGGLLGLGLAAYAAEALTFLLGLALYHRLGYNVRLLFMAHFDRSILKTAFGFGLYDMLGSLAWGIGQSVEILITQTRLVNYAEIWGNWVLAQNFIFGYQVLQTFYNNLMPSISESISHARTKLSQYYAALAYKWGGLISAFLAAIFLAVADRFILGASGPEFVRAATYAVPLVIWGAIQYPSWVGDTVQRASNRPDLLAMLVFIEQVIRIGLAMLLLAKYQIYGLIIAYFVGLLTKGILAYIINNRVCFPQRFYFWQSLGAPLLAGAVHLLILRWVTGMVWRGDQATSVLIFFIGILPSFPLYMFLYGFFGGWDDATLGEVRRAVDLSSFTRPLAWVIWAATALGARISPLHGRFPIDFRPAAVAEAASLTQERISLI